MYGIGQYSNIESSRKYNIYKNSVTSSSIAKCGAVFLRAFKTNKQTNKLHARLGPTLSMLSAIIYNFPFTDNLRPSCPCGCQLSKSTQQHNNWVNLMYFLFLKVIPDIINTLTLKWRVIPLNQHIPYGIYKLPDISPRFRTKCC